MADRAWIGERARALLGHFFRPDDDEDEALFQLADWCDALEDLTEAQIAEACKQRLRQPTRSRPPPGEIRALALKCGGAASVAEQRVATAETFLAQHNAMPQWICDGNASAQAALAETLVDRGHDRETLRKAGYPLAHRGKIADLSEFRARLRHMPNDDASAEGGA